MSSGKERARRVLVTFAAVVAGLAAVLSMARALGGPDNSKEITLAFDPSVIRVVQHQGRDVIILNSPDCMPSPGPVGAPQLPIRTVRVVVPRDAVFEGVTVTDCQTQTLPGTYEPDFIRPSLGPGEEPPPAQPDPLIYEGGKTYPQQVAEFIHSGMMRGYKILFFRVSPLQYLPGTGQILFHSRITLRIEYSIDPAHEFIVNPRKESKVFRRLLERIVDNPQDIDMVSENTDGPQSPGVVEPCGSDDDINYLIITSEQFVNISGSYDFSDLATWKKKKGVNSEIVTVEYIWNNYGGADLEEKIKWCIIDYVNYYGTDYVLLAGDADLGGMAFVPPRICWGGRDPTYGGDRVPCDMWYSCLDDVDWDDNNDGWHAYNGDNFDVIPDVCIGRASCCTNDHVNGLVKKMLEYERQVPATDYARKVLLSGATVDSYGDSEAWTMRMYNDAIAPYGPWDTEEFFDSTAGVSLTANALFNKINEGFSIFTMSCHGFYDSWTMESGGSFGTNGPRLLSNTLRYPVVYTTACLTNMFDHMHECLGEAFTRAPNGGAIAYIGASRVGIWNSSYYGGAGRMFERSFFKYLLGCNYYHIGEAYALMKCDYALFLGQTDTRWAWLTINFLGDPEMPVWTADPQTISATYPSAIAPDPQTIYIRTDPGAYACLWKQSGGSDEVYTHGEADQDGFYSAVISPATTGTLLLTLTKQNHYPLEATIDVSGSLPLSVTTAVLPPVQPGSSYYASLAGGGGTSPYQWSLTSGSLPDGLTIHSEGVITGSPRAGGSYTFTLQVQDANSGTATRQFTLDVDFDAPVLVDMPEPGDEGDYTVSWVAEGLPTQYELQESMFNEIHDGAELDMSQWVNQGWVRTFSVYHSGNFSFYSGSGINLDNTLTYAAPIKVTENTKISYWTWLDIEYLGGDIAFFEISTDGGTTWREIRQYMAQRNSWVQEVIELDLEPYVGQTIQMRFRYTTDNNVLVYAGFCFDDFQVTGICGDNWTTLSATITAQSHDIIGRGPGTYYYRVRAYEGGVWSDWSEPKPVTVEPVPPPPSDKKKSGGLIGGCSCTMDRTPAAPAAILGYLLPLLIIACIYLALRKRTAAP